MISYPNKKKSQNKINIPHANRGMNLEKILNETNQYYLDNNMAVIHKKPTPIQVVKIDYEQNTKIVDAYFQKPSTTDYNGVYKGKYIDFEAKETQSKTSFALNNISTHQAKHLEKVIEQSGIAFLIIYFVLHNEFYFLDAKILIDFYHNEKRKSIPYEFIKKEGHLLRQGYIPRIDYLSIIDEIYLK